MGKLMSDKELAEVAPQKEGMFFDREGNEITMERWAELFEDPEYRNVRRTTFTDGTGEKITVSTVWVGIGLTTESFLAKLSGVEYVPQIFETAKWGEDGKIEVVSRYATIVEAARAHIIEAARANMALADTSPGPINVLSDVKSARLLWGLVREEGL